MELCFKKINLALQWVHFEQGETGGHSLLETCMSRGSANQGRVIRDRNTDVSNGAWRNRENFATVQESLHNVHDVNLFSFYN